MTDDDIHDIVERHRKATAAEARRGGICVLCRQPARFYSEAGRREFEISGLCEYCFDRITAEPEEPKELEEK